MKRIIIIAISIILQLIFYFVFLIGFVEHFPLVQILVSILSIMLVLGIITFNRNVSNKILWIILILAFPILGTLLYLLIGHNLYKSKFLKNINKSIDKSKNYLIQDEKILDKIEKEDLDVFGQINYISKKAKYPIYKANEVQYYPLGEEVYKKMLEELQKAEKFIFMEYFIIATGNMWQNILDILEEKVKNGVDVRVIYDDVGSNSVLPNKYYKELNKKGIKCVAFNELQPIIAVIMNNRDHRKITVIDGKVAFSGGINIADEYINQKQKYGHWKDNGIMIKGEAVWNFTVMFLEIWNTYEKEKNNYNNYKYNFNKSLKTDGYICPYGENPLDNENVGENIYINILNRANKYVYIFTPYLIIDTELMCALDLAVKRGVDVRIVVPGIPDKKIIYSITRSYYPLLLESGVKIYEYTPGFIHSKVFVCDDKIATVGTLNLDYRSLYLHFECGSYIYNCSVIKQIKNDAIDTIDKSKMINKKDLKMSLPRFFLNGILRLFASLL